MKYKTTIVGYDKIEKGLEYLKEGNIVIFYFSFTFTFTFTFCTSKFVPNAYKPVGGNILAHASHTRIEIKGASKKDGKRLVKLIKSASRPNGDCDIGLTPSGVENYQ
jgi:hypothetical protein